ncbi:hypothetical protein [Flavobacterium sp. 102]|uniref:hypothetical protein n=1 Tax=Flavobacterium sp. 102 TaxID=2135623 RepID=UPI000EB47F75|nr:hypothetical protein [Flavobacterium sp. 102]RKS01570.1 hypothetical protein C8C84_1238 [Flavobacterium sp. 102]
MKSKLRTSTVLICVLTTLFFGCISLSFFRDSSTSWNQNSLLGSMTSVLFLVFIFSIYRFGNIVEINLRDEILIVRKPFIFKKMIYKFSDIIGFSFSSYHARGISYRAIKIKALDNTFFISDFETKNFNDLEVILLNKFQLLDQNSKIIDNERRELEIQKREHQKQNQAKEITTLLRYAKILGGFMVLVTVWDLVNRGINTQKMIWTIFCLAFICYVYYKSRSINKNI